MKRAKRLKNEAAEVPMAQVGQVLAPPPVPMSDAAINACKQAIEPMSRPSKAERRAKLIAAHVAIDAIRYELDGGPEHREGLQREIAASIGRLELRD
jgi:hypothetical protein